MNKHCYINTTEASKNKKGEYVVMNVVENMLDIIQKNRISENKNIFSDKEMDIIQQNEKLIKKVYLLGILDATRL